MLILRRTKLRHVGLTEGVRRRRQTLSGKEEDRGRADWLRQSNF